MQKVRGIGGFFFRARDPEALRRWYAETLGIDGAPAWPQQAGPTVFAPFAQTTEYFGAADRQWMINFRVDDLEAMIAELRRKGIEVVTREDWNSEAGTFARIHDPEGNPIELWQPAEGLS